MHIVELIVERAALATERRLAWLASPQCELDQPAEEWSWHESMGHEHATTAVDQALAGPAGEPWRHIVSLFGLDTAEADLLSLAIALDAEPSLGASFAEAQGSQTAGAGGSPMVTEPLVRRLFQHGPRPIWRPSSALAMWSLLEQVASGSLGARGFVADSRITETLFGTLSLSEELVLAVESPAATPAAPSWPVDALASQLAEIVAADEQARVIVTGDDDVAQISFAIAVAAKLGRAALAVDPVALAGPNWSRNFMLAQRFALLGDVALVWRDGGQTWPSKLGRAPLQFLCADAQSTPSPQHSAVDLHVALPPLGTDDKAHMWRALAPTHAHAADEIAAIAGVRLADMSQAARKALPSIEHVGADLRGQSRKRMGTTGRVVDPAYTWDDLVVADDIAAALRRLSFESRTRAEILSSPDAARLFGSSAGLSALFWGAPGVGKSMAAEVIANDLGTNLLIVDLAATMSKYIGETAKNLTAIFAEARVSGAALIFEEADTFFAKRTGAKDANQHYRNGDVNHLLQLLERHDSLVMLSTNDRSSIDPAFIRRLRHIVEFRLPEAADRLALWHTMLDAFAVETAPLQAGLDDLAESFPLSPAQIKSATLTARYAAAAANEDMTLAHLQDGAVRELQKEGRPGVATKARRATTEPRSPSARQKAGRNGSR